MISDKKLYNFCKDHYYCEPYECTSDRELWEPFEGYDLERIETYIDNDVRALKNFLLLNNSEWNDEEN